MSVAEAKALAAKLRKEGKNNLEIAAEIGSTGFKTTWGKAPSPATIGNWLPRLYRRRNKKVSAGKRPPREASSSVSGTQKLRLIETILKSNYMKAEDRVAAALLMI